VFTLFDTTMVTTSEGEAMMPHSGGVYYYLFFQVRSVVAYFKIPLPV